MAEQSGVIIIPAQFPRDREVVASLFAAYAKSLEIDLTFQAFEEELAQLPGKYAPSNGGALFLAHASHPAPTLKTPPHLSPPPSQPKAIGCVALRGFSPPHICELKRLYIAPDSRGLGAGRDLLEAVLARARELGYREMLLDTLPSMVAARKMYAQYGFEEVGKYYESPIEGTTFMKLVL
ncbi:acetyltransferase [Trematosphaeria pertusa]|uniref:Acetyltransferase n=1 Tax=Trematosphaeria pertusa TaxID=390896 RepID=A0A6A6I6X6_9PLEO|nr:acetyltransferase [Trematosphaeria pertusa]KAF2245702.1 acetyltransferase [Trematosphaeria pertusa]